MGNVIVAANPGDKVEIHLENGMVHKREFLNFQTLQLDEKKIVKILVNGAPFWERSEPQTGS